MEVTRIPTAGAIMLRISGRLDGYWADHLERTLAETIREGHYHLRLDLSDVGVISSGGIAVLMKFYKQLQRIDGSLAVTGHSPQVRTVLDITRLTDLLIGPAGGAVGFAPEAADGTRLDRAGAVFDVFDVARGAEIRCRVLGTDAPLVASAFEEQHCSSLPLSDTGFAFGIGAVCGGFHAF